MADEIERLVQLRHLIAEHDARYHGADAPVISDDHYDALKRELRLLESTLGLDAAATAAVGAPPAAGFKKATHERPMLSLDNVFDATQLQAFYARLRKVLPAEACVLAAEPKIDGLALALHYQHGVLVLALTRGDGRTGEDVTAQARTVTDIPQRLSASVSGEVRGEIYMTRADLDALNVQRAEAGLKTFADPRNAAAGSLRLLDAAETARRPLRFFAYAGFFESESVDTHVALRDWLQRLGFVVCPNGDLCADAEAVHAYVERLSAERAQLPFNIDGAVLKINGLADRAQFDDGTGAPRWAVAYKFPAQSAITRLLDVTAAPGRTGVLTPVAVLQPIRVGNVEIRSAGLHNADYIAERDLHIGDSVYVERAGDVIPRVVGVVPALRPADAQPVRMPQTCPACGAPVTRDTDAAAYRCSAPRRCPGVWAATLEYIVSRDVLDVRGLGARQARMLIERGLLLRLADLFTLSRDDLLALPGFAQKSADALLQSIADRRNPPLARLLAALNIPHTGAIACAHLARQYGSIEALRAAALGDFEAFTRIGDMRAEVTAQAVRDFFSDAEACADLDALLEHVTPQPPESVVSTSGPFSGKTLVFTGTLSMPRPQAEALARAAGARIGSALSRKTDALIVGADPGSKADKAAALGVAIWDEARFLLEAQQ